MQTSIAATGKASRNNTPITARRSYFLAGIRDIVEKPWSYEKQYESENEARAPAESLMQVIAW